MRFPSMGRSVRLEGLEALYRGHHRCSEGSTDTTSDSGGFASPPRVISYSTHGHRPFRTPSIGNAHTRRSPNPRVGSGSSGHTNAPVQRVVHHSNIAAANEDRGVKGRGRGKWPVQVSHRPEACCGGTMLGASLGRRKSHRPHSQGKRALPPRAQGRRDEAPRRHGARSSPEHCWAYQGLPLLQRMMLSPCLDPSHSLCVALMPAYRA
jgi:hypothetical protein